MYLILAKHHELEERVNNLDKNGEKERFSIWAKLQDVDNAIDHLHIKVKKIPICEAYIDMLKEQKADHNEIEMLKAECDDSYVSLGNYNFFE